MKYKKESPAKQAYVIENSTAATGIEKQGAMERFTISSRALQKYRKQKLVPYEWLCGKIFNYLPRIVKALEASANRQGVRY